MTDHGDSPEVHNNSKERKSPLQIKFEQMSKKPSPTPEDGDSVDETATEEEMMQESAKKMAALQQEILELARNYPADANGEAKFLRGKITQSARGVNVRSYIDEMDGGLERTPEASLTDNHVSYAKDAGIETSCELTIENMYLDESTREAFKNFYKNIKAEGFQTVYYFNENGDYAKVVKLNDELVRDSNRHPIGQKGYRTPYLSEMTGTDFEIASTALLALRDKLLPQGSTDTADSP